MINKVKIKIKSCTMCPFSEAEIADGVVMFANCLAPKEIHNGNYDILDAYENKYISINCPLIGNSLKISI